MNKYIKKVWHSNVVQSCIPDKLYLKLEYRHLMGKKLNLKNPKSFNEKLQWLKLYDRNPLYTDLVDKIKVKEIVGNKIGFEHIIPTLGVYNNFEEIDFDVLPNQFVVKPNHTSGDVFVCKDKNKLDKHKLKEEIDVWLKRKYFYNGREWPYKNVNPKILIEKYMVDESGVELKDYKIFCFSGVPKIIEVDFDRFIGHKRNLYDVHWNLLDMTIEYPNEKNCNIKKPVCLDELINYACMVSKDFPHIRTDFYVINNEIYFGELTFYHESGFGMFNPLEWDYKFGEWLILNNNE